MPSTVILLMTVFFSVYLILPLGSWLLFAGRQDKKARLWFIGIMLLSLGMCLIIVRPYIPAYLSHQLPWIMTLSSWLVMIDSIRQERQRSPVNWFWPGWFLVAWSVFQTWVYVADRTEGLGLATYALTMALASSTLGWQLFQLNRARPSKCIIWMIVAVLLYAIPNIVRVMAYVWTGDETVMNVFKFSWQANLLSAAYVVAFMMISFGYWGFTLEKSERERRLAQAGEDEALQDAEHYRQLVQERDHLLVMNSRFSVVSALSSFSAMLVHDISQPLQTLQLGLERICKRIDKGTTPEEIRVDLKYLEQASERAGHLVTSLRHLMRNGESQTVQVVVKPLFTSIMEILDSEALQRKVSIAIECDLSPGCAVLCEPTMLQRIVINLVSNSLNQFQRHPVAIPKVSIILSENCQQELAGVLIEVADNGGGFPQELLARLGQPWSSTTPDGMGLALVLSKQLVGQWGGSLTLSNRSDGLSGAVVRIWLRQAA